MRPAVMVSWAGLVFETTMRPLVEGSGARVTVESLRGWWGAAPDRSTVVEHPSGDGVRRLLARRGARQVEIRGLMQARSQGELLDAREMLLRQSVGVLVVDEPTRGVTREADCWLVDLDVTDLSPTVARYTLTLQADDPVRWGSHVQALVNGANPVANRGNLVASGLLRLVGPHGGVSITSGASAWSMSPLPAGASRLVDVRHAQTWDLATGARVYGESTGAVPLVQVGGSTWTVAGLDTGSATLARHEAWL